MKVEFEIKKKLYNVRNQKLSNWPNITVGMESIPGVVSKQNKTRNQVSKASTIGMALDRLIDGKISVCPIISQTMTYVEYQASTGEIIGAFVDVIPAEKKFTILIDSAKETAAVAIIFAATCFNIKIQEAIVNQNTLEGNKYDVYELDTYMKNFPNISEEEMFKICDVFYYCGIGKEYKIQYEQDEAKFDASKKGIAQKNNFMHAKETAAPCCIKIDEKQQVTQDVRSSIFVEPLDAFMKRCKRGEFIIDYDWNDFQLGTIKPLTFLDLYVPTEEFRELLLSIWFQLSKIKQKMDDGVPYDEVMTEPVNVQIMGKPGTGKTTMVDAIFCALGLPHGFINCKGRSEEDEFEGLNKVIQGHICSVPTQLAMFYSIGGGVLLEEINLPDPDIPQGAIGQALVYPYILKVDGYKEYKRHPLTVIFATLNVGTNGTKPMNQGLKSRFDEGVVLEDVDEDSFKNIVYKTGYDKKYCDIAIKGYKTAINYLTMNGNDDFILSITLRGCKKCAQKLANGFTRRQAFRTGFISQIYSEDPDVAMDLEEYLDKMV